MTGLAELARNAARPWWWRVLQRLPNAFPGKGRLMRLQSPSGPVSFRMSDGSIILVPDGREPLVGFAACFGSYEPATLSVLTRAHAQRGGSIIDVGANVGLMAIPLARLLSAGEQLLAIEAVPAIFQFLQHNLRSNGLSVVAVNALCGESEAVAVPFFGAPESSFGMGSRGPQYRAEPSAHLPMHTLDHLVDRHALGRIGVIKVDVEGFEREVFIGARECLQRDRPLIVFEFNDWAEQRRGDVQPGAAQEVLLQLGYQLLPLLPDGKTGAPLAEPVRQGSCMLVATSPT